MTSNAQPTAYDPYLYAYMRACGYPRGFYSTYLHQLRVRRRQSHPRTPKAAPTPPPFPNPDWLTPKVRTLALMYTDKPLPPTNVTASRLERAVMAVESTPNAKGARRSGLTRRLLHAQAKHWAALIAAHPITDTRTYVDMRERPVSELVAEARAARHANAKRRANDRHNKKLLANKLRMEDAVLKAARAKYAKANADYLVARSKYHLARDAHMVAAAKARVATNNPYAQAPRELVIEKNQAYREYVQAKAARRKAAAEFKAKNC